MTRRSSSARTTRRKGCGQWHGCGVSGARGPSLTPFRRNPTTAYARTKLGTSVSVSLAQRRSVSPSERTRRAQRDRVAPLGVDILRGSGREGYGGEGGLSSGPRRSTRRLQTFQKGRPGAPVKGLGPSARRPDQRYQGGHRLPNPVSVRASVPAVTSPRSQLRNQTWNLIGIEYLVFTGRCI